MENKLKSGLIVNLDFGHGGIIDGKYQTAGKRSPDWECGVLYEGVSNREFGRNIMDKLDKMEVPYFCSITEESDVPLHKRVSRANTVYSTNNHTYTLSLHSNAGGGTGFEGFTSKGQTTSDLICEAFLQDLKDTFPDIKMRQDTVDGDMDKEEDFYILTGTRGPSVLLELLFMDQLQDYFKLHDQGLRSRIEDCIAGTIRNLYYGTN